MLPFFFYTFAIILVVSSIMVIVTKNPVHSVFFLILAFFNATGLFVLMGAEFLAMLLLVVYVGAVAVLFLFVVMMLNIDFKTLRKGMIKNALTKSHSINNSQIDNFFMGMTYGVANQPGNELFLVLAEEENTRGKAIEANYIYLFQCAGLILLVAMIGAIVLTHRKRDNAKHAGVVKVLMPSDVVEIKKIEIGKGIL